MYNCMIFEVSLAVQIRRVVSCVVTLCSFVDRQPCFGVTCFFLLQEENFYIKIKTARSSEILVTTYQVTRCHN
jgi:hypothetical protein